MVGLVILSSITLTGQQMTDTPNSNAEKTAVATLGGGCFWCLEPVFQELKGVEDVVVGYSGGSGANPSYERVCTGETGHAEVVQITYHPDEISFGELLTVFFSIHDPTTLNRQGADVGTQYRSAIFSHGEHQKEITETIITEMESEDVWDDPIVTEVTEFDTFYQAGDYHQEYYEKNPNAGYCQLVIAPKMKKFRKKFEKKLKD